MLSKLFKYEMKATGRILLPALGVTLIMGIINGLMYMFMPNVESPNAVYAAVSIVFTVLLVLVSVATVALSYIYAIYRFQRNLLGKEGYLMNTLPVSTAQNILAKMFAAMIYEALAILVVIFTYGIFLTLIISNDVSFTEFWSEMWRAVTSVFAQIDGEAWIMFAELAVLIIVSLAYSNLMFYASMSIGYSSNSHKALKSVGIYVGFYIVCQIIGTILMSTFAVSVGTGELNSMGSFHALMIIGIIFEAAIAAAYWFITSFFMKKRLNLQ